jgi:hypothetical protein
MKEAERVFTIEILDIYGMYIHGKWSYYGTTSGTLT